ncbi:MULTISPECIES: hypothetical protein [Cyanophyceae]|uniref:DUF6930 domain-containing protein n=1 Tax=Cyanophyceae TaxID=3028117 RepID=UPI0016889B93|nr:MULTISPECIES: hypothetical protein [Cyanophyceae]MBD1918537.1 hypothetical protein [Phormidium sp. FACHB-77]MBD2031426.1 hypothetical protein [Phormidium sp. FACHB-322]MBD2049545.1 hypothetical protein [Leptolyngbya sp. FACHB-60]
MTRLNRITIDRLKRLPRVASVWEGDRRSVGGLMDDDAGLRQRHTETSDCILWVDSSHGAVRGLTIVPTTCGYEPVVRTLLQAIESPQGNLAPARPHKIVVSDREIQFYLRGALQGLDIAIDYAPELPLIDELFNALQQSAEMTEAELPPRYAEAMIDKAMEIWELAPWNTLNEQQVLAVELNTWDLDTLYVSMLGMGGVEYGLLMYRSLDSLKQFRQRVLMGQQSPKQMQEAFLEQDCLFLNFELFDDEPFPNMPQPVSWLASAPEAVQPDFGSIHPLEGMRSQLADEEGATFLVVLEALQRFITRYRAQLEKPPLKALQSSYKIPNPEKNGGASPLKVTVKTLPEVTAELAADADDVLGDDPEGLVNFPVLRDDYVPEGAIIILTQFQQQVLNDLRHDSAIAFQGLEGKWTHNGTADSPDLPVVLIQTSRPKAKTLIQQLQQAQGVQAVCFNPGSDPFSGEAFELGMLQTGDGELHLFAEYETNGSTDRHLLERWNTWQKECKGACAVIIASGITGSSKGKPSVKDILGVFEARCKTPKDLHLPPLMLQYAAEWERD